ncbi:MULTISPECIES: BCCT family transporter [Prauserella salsuginis group]|uniref:BCCT family transporter n=1 Tax=Prauserella salsuginis TaxID=387889 RepID=A0ABW6FXY8_9PSEU|nr:MULTISPECIES: BCCT family transporter [Prauserella salsuginis group]MCR3720266.1 choline/glycine/proline betaine transport protein [Prauserella flava]MCR3734026.1 choline/glycine/proline betaine transport protein [Prauserella salsuginis]
MSESNSGHGGPSGEEPAPPGQAVEGSIAQADATHDEIEDELRRQGVRLGRGGIAPSVFWPSLIVVAAIALFSIIAPETAGNLWNSVQGEIVTGFGWFYTLAIAGFVLFAIFLGVSRFGDITLGKDGEEPEFGLFSWFTMLFAAGMGIGLVFYGVGEPLTFYSDPKPGVDGGSAELASQAMAQTFLHWGFHPWAVYVIVGLSLAYAIHRKGRPVSIRWALEPLLGDKVKGWPGDVIDVLAIVGTLFGVATSLGLGVTQVASGLSEIGVVDEANNLLLVVLIVAITLVAIVSVVSGIGRGIRWLSNFNLSLAGVFLIAVLLLGPTLFLARDFVQSLGAYLANVLPLTFDAFAYTGDAGIEWAGSWTIFYWGWWIAWAPFVGVFIARISRGRTVREFVAGALLVPTLVGFLWFTVMGGTAIDQQQRQGDLVPEGGVVAEEALFNTLQNLPLGLILSVIAIILVVIFFVTSSDSGSLVVDMLASGGHPDPPIWSRVLFASLEGLVAIGLLLAGGDEGLSALQAGAVSTGLPFAVVLVAMAVALYKALNSEHRAIIRAERRIYRRELAGELSQDFDRHFGEQVDDRIDYALSTTTGIWNRADKRTPISTLSRARRRGKRQRSSGGPSDEGGPSGGGGPSGEGGPSGQGGPSGGGGPPGGVAPD